LGCIFDTIGTGEELKHLGVGEPYRIIRQEGRGRFRNAPGGLGLLGQRIGWMLKALHLAIIHAPTLAASSSVQSRRKADVLCRIGHRCIAFIREGDKALGSDGDFLNLRPSWTRALKLLASIVRTSHGDPPLLAQWANGRLLPSVDKLKASYDDLMHVHMNIMSSRRRAQVEAARRWAKLATLAELHKASKLREAPHRKTASASKAHGGERTDFQAARQGACEQ
jgi:hypothetical protein